jgi:hypothetical protein
MYGSTPGAGYGQAISTDDISLQVFIEHLKRLVCRNLSLCCVFVARIAHIRLLVLKHIKLLLFISFSASSFVLKHSIINPWFYYSIFLLEKM